MSKHKHNWKINKITAFPCYTHEMCQSCGHGRSTFDYKIYFTKLNDEGRGKVYYTRVPNYREIEDLKELVAEERSRRVNAISA